MQESERLGNPQVTQAELAWLAGILDGEGSMGITTGSDGQFRIGCMINIANSDAAILNKVYSIYDRLGIKYHAIALKSKNKPVTNVRLIKEIEQAKLLPTVFPYLTRLRDHARILARFLFKRINRRRLREWDIETIKCAVSLAGKNGSDGTAARIMAMSDRLIEVSNKQWFDMDKESHWGTSETIREELSGLLEAMI